MSTNYFMWVSFVPVVDSAKLSASFNSAITTAEKIEIARALGEFSPKSPVVPPSSGSLLYGPKGAIINNRAPMECGIFKGHPSEAPFNEFNKGWRGKGLACRTSGLFIDLADAEKWLLDFGDVELELKHAIVYFIVQIA